MGSSSMVSFKRCQNWGSHSSPVKLKPEFVQMLLFPFSLSNRLSFRQGDFLSGFSNWRSTDFLTRSDGSPDMGWGLWGDWVAQNRRTRYREQSGPEYRWFS